MIHLLSRKRRPEMPNLKRVRSLIDSGLMAVEDEKADRYTDKAKALLNKINDLGESVEAVYNKPGSEAVPKAYIELLNDVKSFLHRLSEHSQTLQYAMMIQERTNRGRLEVFTAFSKVK